MHTNPPSTLQLAAAPMETVPLVVARGHQREPSVRADRPPVTQVWGTDFARLTMHETIKLAEQVVRARRPEYFITANLNYLMLTEQHPRLSEINQRSIAVLADGAPIVRRSRCLPHPLPSRVTGADLVVELARMAARNGYRIFLLGAAPGVARAAADELLCQFPQLQIAGCYSPPFRSWTSAEQSDMLAEIRESKTDILLVAFGQPKGEFWIYDNLHELSVPLSIQLGASFDFLAGTARRAPLLWQRFGCEWLYRAISNPRRLLPRYAANVAFLLKCKLGDARRAFTSEFKVQERNPS